MAAKEGIYPVAKNRAPLDNNGEGDLNHSAGIIALI
jgi:hypothetical protein